MSRSKISSPFLSSRASMILRASSSVFRFHLFKVCALSRREGSPLYEGGCFASLNKTPRSGAEKSFVYTAPVGFSSLLNRYTESTLAVPSTSIVAASSRRVVLLRSAEDASALTRATVRCGEKARGSGANPRWAQADSTSRNTASNSVEAWAPTHKMRARLKLGKEPKPPIWISKAGMESTEAQIARASSSTLAGEMSPRNFRVRWMFSAGVQRMC